MSSTKPRLSFEQLAQERCYLDLTPKQQKMVETFIKSDGDRVLSVLTAYQAKNAEVARVMAYEFFENPKVIACLTAYFQDDPLDVFKKEVQRAWRNKRLSVAQVTAMKLYCDLNGWGSSSLPRLNGYKSAEPEAASKTEASAQAPAPEADRFKVGDIAVQDGKKYRVTSIDANGQPLTADEIE